MQNTNTVNTLVEIEHDNNLSGFSMSYTHMRMPHSYYFNLYQLRENILFTASCDIEKNGKRINIQNKQVSQDFWDEFILLSKKLKICNFPEYEYVHDPETLDQTEYNMSLLFSKIPGTMRKIAINPDPETWKELEEFFYKKAKEANDEQCLE